MEPAHQIHLKGPMKPPTHAMSVVRGIRAPRTPGLPADPCDHLSYLARALLIS